MFSIKKLSNTAFSILLGKMSNPSDILTIDSEMLALLFIMSIITGRFFESILKACDRFPCWSMSIHRTLAPYRLALIANE